ncbi:carbohydrate ABC transporter permease [Pseudonocardia sp. MH-G8]|uniref:carbohydrate ABC transporter permease n=1 Tax=Pseudonocardia sp. MH-G8 TaxID=1854588 RepID=UPI000BA09C12|nr:sugar ABC transporter permease [Pseudonocardia sp. MH-G8]OZM77951.1 sugar ABC transporter permease [Pseudonocardia sp. MH-G8]
MSRSGRSARSVRSARRGWALSAPALAVVGLVTLVPIGFAVFLSLNEVSARRGSVDFRWVGADNYVDVLGSEAMRHALAFTTLYTVISVVIELVIGLALALVLDRMTVGRPAVLAMLLAPWAMVTVIAGHLWSYIFNGVYGIANHILIVLHLVQAPVSFLDTPARAFATLVVADAWKTVPFVALILLGGLRGIDRELYAAARVDGAGPARTLFRITLPLVKSALITAVVFRVLQAFGVFDLPFVLTGGGPGRFTQSVAMLAYTAMFQDLDLGAGAAISSVAALLVLVVVIAFIRLFRFQVDPTER